MKKIYVLYDPTCAFCRRCRQWLSQQPAYFELVFLGANSDEVKCRIEGIEKFAVTSELTVVTDEGAVYQGPNAFIFCLYALVEFREWSLRLANPTLLPFARNLFDFISTNRFAFSKWFQTSSDEEIAITLRKYPPLHCATSKGQC